MKIGHIIFNETCENFDLKKGFAFKSNNIVNKVMLWLKIILRWIFGLLIVCFVFLFKERNKYLAKKYVKIRKILAKINKKTKW